MTILWLRNEHLFMASAVRKESEFALRVDRGPEKPALDFRGRAINKQGFGNAF